MTKYAVVTTMQIVKKKYVIPMESHEDDPRPYMDYVVTGDVTSYFEELLLPEVISECETMTPDQLIALKPTFEE